jgi:hypothetical protein
VPSSGAAATQPDAPAPPRPARTVPHKTMTALDRRDMRRFAPLAAAIGGACLLLLAGVVVVRSCGSSDVPEAAEDALERWQDGKYEEGGALLEKALSRHPGLAADPAVARALAAGAHSGNGRRVLARLLADTPLGGSAPLAAALADVATDGPESARTGAIEMLRGRHGLLPPEQAARLAYRDAADCAALEKALARLAQLPGSPARADLQLHESGRCREVMARPEVCACPPPRRPR